MVNSDLICWASVGESCFAQCHGNDTPSTLRSADFNLLLSWGYFCVGDEGGPKLLQMTVYSQKLSKFQNQQEDGFNSLPRSFFTSQKGFLGAAVNIM